LQNNICRLAALNRPSDDTAGVEIDNDSQIGKAFQRPDIGDVRDPDAIRFLNVELAVQGIVDDQRWLAAMVSRPALVANLRFDTSQFASRATRFGQLVSP